MKEFFRDWGWLLTAALLPLALFAAERKFVTRSEYEPLQMSVAKLHSDVRHHIGDMPHPGWRELALEFVPRQELAPTLEDLKNELQRSNDKLDDLLSELRKR